MIEILSYIILGFAFIRSLICNYRIIESFEILKSRYRSLLHQNSTKPSNKKIFILIPLLREQDLIGQLIPVFSSLKGNYKTIFITTKKEEYEHKKFTINFIEKIPFLVKIKSKSYFIEETSGFFYKSYAIKVFDKLKKVSDKEKFLIERYTNKPYTRDLLKKKLKKNMSIINYPYTKGVMSHQLNYACKKLSEKYKTEDVFISVYNADSVIDSDYVNILNQLIPRDNVIQQSAIFLNNFPHASKTFREGFLKGNGLLQTRWTLAHEIPHIYRQENGKLLSFLESGSVVGHGVCINLKLLLNTGGFPTQFVNEDLPLGFLLRLQGEHISLYPKLENANTPITIKAVFEQYKTWFYGVLYYPKYLYFFLTQKKSTYKQKVLSIFWTFKAIFRGFIWLFLSITWLYLFVYPVITHNFIFFILSIFTFIFYSSISWILVVYCINKNNNLISSYKPIYLNGIDLLSTFLVYLTHSLGPIFAIYEILKSLINNKEIVKKKTER